MNTLKDTIDQIDELVSIAFKNCDYEDSVDYISDMFYSLIMSRGAYRKLEINISNGGYTDGN